MPPPAKPLATTDAPPQLERGIGLGSATALNMIDMIGVGPFITIPLIVGAMGGPQAMLGWILGAFFAVCDGLVWAELGAAFPGTGGSYRYLNEIYGRNGLGRLLSFLFIWQLTFSAPLSIASGCLGFSQYASFFWPKLATEYSAHEATVPLGFLGAIQVRWLVNGGTFLAIATCLFAVFLLYRRIAAIGWISKVLWSVVMGTIAWIIFAGITHFDGRMAFSFPPDAFRLSSSFFSGLGAAMLIANYDYWGYYNVAFLGGEVRNPEKNIPRALLLSIFAVACLYIVMNITILGVIPWQELVATSKSDTHFFIISVFMQRIYGQWAAYLATALIMWTAFASVFSLLLGYSRVPYAAATDGNYFRAFAKVHPQHRFPHISLLVLGGVAALCCFLRLADVIASLVVIRILLQFLVQAIGVIVLRIRRPDLPRPFRMWLFPLPALLACGGFLFVLFKRPHAERALLLAALVLTVGVCIYLIRAWQGREWPFPVSASNVPQVEN
jgi:amino acid transporter